MSGRKDLYPFIQLSDIHSVAIADGHSCHVSEERVVQTSSQLRLEKILYVPVSAITKQLLCYVTFFSTFFT